jgi:metal transporter CNNM
MGWVRDILKSFVITSGDFADYQDVDDVFNAFMAFVCVLCAGLAAGLTMGLLSLDATKLEIKVRVGNPQEKLDAEAVLPIVRQHHLLLVTLLLFNSIANETLPIFLGQLVPNYVAILLAVFLILIFGEILPSAFFTGAHQLRTSARMVPFVYCLIAVLYPVAYPISKALDRLFGHGEDEHTMTRSELEALVLMQQVRIPKGDGPHPTPKSSRKINDSYNSTRSAAVGSGRVNYGAIDEADTTALLDDVERGEHSAETTRENSDVIQAERHAGHCGGGSPDGKHHKHDGLSASEVTLMLGVLNLSKHDVGCAMIPMENVFMVSSANRLDDENFLRSVVQSGFSRIPVYHRQDNSNIMGYMLVKELITVSVLQCRCSDSRNTSCVWPGLDHT